MAGGGKDGIFSGESGKTGADSSSKEDREWGTRGKKGTVLGRMGGRVEGSGEGMGGGQPEARDGGDGSREATVRERRRWEGVKVDPVNGPIGLDFWAFSKDGRPMD